jgi:hypothetical protein
VTLERNKPRHISHNHCCWSDVPLRARLGPCFPSNRFAGILYADGNVRDTGGIDSVLSNQNVFHHLSHGDKVCDGEPVSQPVCRVVLNGMGAVDGRNMFCMGQKRRDCGTRTIIIGVTVNYVDGELLNHPSKGLCNCKPSYLLAVTDGHCSDPLCLTHSKQ